MRSFYRKRKNCFLVLDIGTESVKALISGPKNGKTKILGGALEYFDKFGVFDTTGFEREVIKKAMAKAIEEIQKQAKIKSEFAKITLPADILKVKILWKSFSRKSLKRIDKREEREILETARVEAQKEISQKFSLQKGILPADFQFLDSKILEMKISGYEVPQLFGFSGNRLDFKILLTFLAKYHFQEYQKIFQQLELKKVELLHLSQCLNSLIGEEKEGVFLDIGGNLTQGFLIKNGKLESIFDFPIGGKTFSESLSETLGLSSQRAQVLKESYQKRELSEPVRKRISQIFSKDLNLWFLNLKNNLTGVIKNVFLFGGGAELSEIEEILKDNEFSPKIILPKDLAPIEDFLLTLRPFLDSPQFTPLFLILNYGQKNL